MPENRQNLSYETCAEYYLQTVGLFLNPILGALKENLEKVVMENVKKALTVNNLKKEFMKVSHRDKHE